MPGYTKTILCLANSRKLGGRCVAGREIGENGVGQWIRPVSNHGHGEVSEADRRFENGVDPMVLDIVEIPMLRPIVSTSTGSSRGWPCWPHPES